MSTLKNPCDPSGRRVLFKWGIFWLYNFLLIRGAVLPASEFPRWLAFLNDKAVHAAEFFVLFLLSQAVFSISAKRGFFRAAVFSSVYSLLVGAATEIAQFWVPSRSPEAADFAADALGVFAALIFMAGMNFKKEKK